MCIYKYKPGTFELSQKMSQQAINVSLEVSADADEGYA